MRIHQDPSTWGKNAPRNAWKQILFKFWAIVGHSVPPSYANVQIRQGGFPTAVNKIGKQFYSHVKLFWGFTVLRFRHTYSTAGWPQIPSPVFPLLLGRAAIFAGLAPFTGIHVGYKPRRAFFMLFPPVQCPRSPVTSTLCAACYKRTILLPSCHTFWTVAQLCFGVVIHFELVTDAQCCCWVLALKLSHISNLLQMHNAVTNTECYNRSVFTFCDYFGRSLPRLVRVPLYLHIFIPPHI